MNSVRTMSVLSLSLCLGLMSVPADAAKTVKRHIYKGRVSASILSADRLLVKGKYDQAADHYRTILKRNPNDVNAKVGLGMALAEQFKLDGADEQFDKVLAADSSNPGAHAGKAMVLLARLQSSANTIRKNRDSILKEAESETQKALDADQQMPEAHYTMGMIYKEQGRYGEAADQFKAATQIDSSFASGYTGQGLVKLAQHNPGGAQADFKQAIRLNSGDYTAHYGMGQALFDQGKVDASIKELNTSLYQFRNSWPVHLALGRAYETQGNTVAAVREYQESIRIKPENSAPYLGIANIRES
ncbi:MAG TPA: tetratricopeptide repeat protein, partial [Chroococcales cyanobacterium]